MFVGFGKQRYNEQRLWINHIDHTLSLAMARMLSGHAMVNHDISKEQRVIASRCFRLALFAALSAGALLGPALGSAARADEPGAQADAAPAGPPWLGLIADRGWKEPGVRVEKVLRTSPAEKAKLQPGDVVTVVNGKTINKVFDFKIVMRELRAGDELEIEYRRGGEKKSAKLTLAPLPSQRDLVVTQLMGRKVPDVSLSTLPLPKHGQREAKFDLHDLKGKPVVIDFWATWCRPCVPFTEQVQKTAKAHDGKIHAVAISNESKDLLVKHYDKKSSLAYRATHDPEGVVEDALFVRSYPMVIVLDGDLKVRKVITGNDDPKIIEETVRSLLAADAQ